MRRTLLLLGLPLLLASSPALAHGSSYDDDAPDPESYDAHRKIEIGIDLEAYRSSSQLTSGSGVTGGYLGMHGRFGRRVALGFGLDQGYGDDGGYKRFDLAWNLPKLYLYLNPASKSQLYLTTGMDMRVSHYEDGATKLVPAGTPWGAFYFGSFLGGGLEHRMDKGMALRLETRWFMRGRASGNGGQELDPTFAKDTANQRGGVITLGLTFF